MSIWLMLIVCILVLVPFFEARANRKVHQKILLREKWKIAREKRILWKEEHPWANFDDFEYQELWEIEIGAEVVYIFVTRCRKYGISWSDWSFARKKAQQEMDDK